MLLVSVVFFCPCGVGNNLSILKIQMLHHSLICIWSVIFWATAFHLGITLTDMHHVARATATLHVDIYGSVDLWSYAIRGVLCWSIWIQSLGICLWASNWVFLQVWAWFLLVCKPMSWVLVARHLGLAIWVVVVRSRCTMLLLCVRTSSIPS